MNITEFSNSLRFRLGKLSDSNVLLFGLNICNRLLPHYLEFYKKSLWGNPDTLLESIHLCETTDCFDAIHKDKLLRLSKQIDTIIPDTEEFEDGSLALNASASVLELIEFVLDKNVDHILNVSHYMIDTVDFISWEEEADESAVTKKVCQEMKYQIEFTNTF